MGIAVSVLSPEEAHEAIPGLVAVPKEPRMSIAVSVLSPEEAHEAIPGLVAMPREPRMSSKPSQDHARLLVSLATGRRNRSLS
jgi:hypothetical protein